MFTAKQQEVLAQGLDEGRVHTAEGMSHLQAWDVRRWLIRIFGFGGFSMDTTDLELLYEQSKEENGLRWRAAYRATVRLEVDGATYTESAVGTNIGWLPDSKRDEAHDMAIKTATSQAMKRCAVNLGDQFGLSLYRKGGSTAVVVRTVPMTEARYDKPLNTETEGYADEPVPAEQHDPTVEVTETAETAETTQDPTVMVQMFTKGLEEASAIEPKAKRASAVSRIGIEIKKADVGKQMTSHNVTLDTLVDWAFDGKVPQP